MSDSTTPVVVRDAPGGIVIRSRVALPPGRQGFEKQFFPGVDVDLAGWERAHSQGNITGSESPNGIRYAPTEVNQAFQRLGVEKFIQELFAAKAPDVEFELTTITYTHPGTLGLREIQYRIDALRDGRAEPLFEASIEVENRRQLPRIAIAAAPRLSSVLWRQYLK